MSVDDLQNKIKQKLDFLSTSVDTLKEQQKTLQENSDRAKTYVHASCDKDINRLKLRERNLIQQLESVTATQKQLLDSQIVKLLLIKGSLRATQKILHECQFEDITALTSLYDGYVTSLKPVEATSTHSVERLIDSAIMALKNFYLPDHKTQDHRSSAVSSRLEDYGDADHHVLHKNICTSSEAGASEEGSAIVVRVPKMPAGGWLAKSSIEKCQEKDIKSRSDDLPEGKLNQDMSSWLADLHMSELSEGNRLGGSFDLLDDEFVVTPRLERIKSRCSSVSSSIEVVSSLDSEKEMSCLSGSDFDNSKSCWLSISRSDNKKVPLDTCLDVEEFACQANEPCNSYKDCLCNGYCKELANERAMQTSKWLLKSALEQKAASVVGEEPCKEVPHPTGIKRKLSPSDGGNEVIKHMRYILSSDRKKWLVSTSGTVLAPESGADHNILYKPRFQSWLRDPMRTSESKMVENGPIVSYSPHSNVWLLHKLKEERKRDQEEKNRVTQEETRLQDHEKSFRSIEENYMNTGVSVTDLQGALAELSVLLPKYSPTSTSNTYTNAFYTYNSTQAANALTHNVNYLYRNNDFDLARKLKWLSRPHSKSHISGRGECLPQSASFLPDSLVVFAERNLDKWLINRL